MSLKFNKIACAAMIAFGSLALSAADNYNAAMNIINQKSKENNVDAVQKEVVDTLARSGEKLKPEEKFTLELIAGGLACNGDTSKIVVPKNNLTPEQVADAFFKAGKVFYGMRNNQVAQFFAATKQAPVPFYEVGIVEQAPVGVESWNKSDLFKQLPKENRFEKYNQKAAALLINDVNLVRNNIDKANAAECTLSFVAAADKNGLHIYMENKDDKVEEVLAGLEGGGMVEMYLQPGFENPYYQWMMDLATGKVDFINWTSNNKNFRLIDGKYCKSEVAPIKGGLGAYLFIDWELLYDNLPTDESNWVLGVVPWVRNGGFTWGSGQVHELHKYGQLKFNGIEKITPQIKRRLVMKAWGNFRRNVGDIRTFWNDEYRGDLKFSQEVLEPKIAELEALGKNVSVKMDDKIVDMLYSKAVKEWNEFSYIVSEMRSEYLKKQLLNK